MVQSAEANLIANAKNGDDLAFEEILIQHKNLVNSICRRYFLIGGDVDDLLQEGMIGLFKAVKTFDSTKTASFKTYATTVVERQILNAIKKASSQKHSPLSDYVALNNQGGIDSESDNESGIYYIANVNSHSPEKLVLSNDGVKQLLKQISVVLSGYEKTILEHYLNGLTYSQIAKELNKTAKSIDNALNRIKNKLKFLNKA